MISIAITGKQDREREKIITALEEQHDFKIISTGEDGYHALDTAMKQHPDIIMLDINMGDSTAADLAPVIKRHSPATELIALYSPDEYDAVEKAYMAGIAGCFPKNGTYENLDSSVRSVYYGGLYFGKTIRDRMLIHLSASKSFTQTPHQNLKNCFTKTESCILSGIVLGHTDKEIAKNLNMHTGSLRNCVSCAKRKTGCKNRVQTAVYALLAGALNAEKIKEQLVKKGEEN